MFDMNTPLLALIAIIFVGMVIAVGQPLISSVEQNAATLPSIAWLWPMALVFVVVLFVVIRFRQQTGYYGGRA